MNLSVAFIDRFCPRGASKERIILVLFVCIIFLPFINKGFHVDDPFYIWIAQHIQQDPLNFYGFNINWSGFEQTMATGTANPPMFSYYMALVASMLGWNPVTLHLAALVPTIAAALGIYQLAGLFGANRLQTSVLAVATPTFVLCGTSVMLDMAMTSLFIWAIYFWLKGLEHNAKRSRFLVYSSLLIACAILTKYFALSLIPLLAAYALLRRAPFFAWFPFLLFPMLIFFLYNWWTFVLYGFIHFTYTSNFSLSNRDYYNSTLTESIIVGLSFLGGCVAIPLAFAPHLLKFRGWLISIGGVCFAMILLFAWCIVRGKNLFQYWEVYLQMAILIVIGVGLLIATITEFWREKNAYSALLFFWIAGVIYFTCFVNQFVAGRNILPLIPAVAIVMVKRLSRNKTSTTGFLTSLTILLCITLSVSIADYRYANEIRSLSKSIINIWKQHGGNLWYQTNSWGLQYYLGKAGGKAISQNALPDQPGDLVVTHNYTGGINPLKSEYYPVLQTLTISPFRWLSNFNESVGANFYCSILGPLPFAVGRVKPDQFEVRTIIPNPN